MSEHLNIGGFRYRFRLLNADGSVADDFEADNLVPQGGLSFLLLAPFGDSAPISSFYCGLWRANVLPSSALKAADIPSNLQEFVGYSEATRPLWERAHDGVGTLDNAGAVAEFNFTADATLYGSILVSDPTKGGNSGLLLSCVRFPSPRPVVAGQKGQLIAGITYVPTNVI